MTNANRNIGVEAARAAATAIGAKLAIPSCNGDFNDLMQETGIEEVRRQILDRAQDVPKRTPTSESPDDLESTLTDDGFALRFVQASQETVRYLADTGEWVMREPNGHWRVVDGELTELIRRCARDVYLEARNAATRAEQDALAKFAKQCQNWQRIKSCRELAKSDPRIARVRTDFKGRPGEVPVQNGIVSLAEAKLRPAGAKDMNLCVAPVEYDAHASRPTNWLRYLRAVQPDRRMRRYLQKVFGLVLSGNSEIEVLFFVHGPGASGKSTFIKVQMALLGDLARKFPVDALLKKGRKSTEHELQPCIGARLAVAGEIPASAEFDDAKLKNHASSDKLETRPLYGHQVDFSRTHFLVCYGNHQPKVPSQSDTGFWRRLHVIPFNQVIPQNERDTDLFDKKLRPELPGILLWAIKGYQRFLKEGLTPPDTAIAAMNEYIASNDPVGRFIEECCVEKRESKVNATALYERYKSWCESQGERWLNRTAFGIELREHGFTEESGRKTTIRGKVFYKGIALLNHQ